METVITIAIVLIGLTVYRSIRTVSDSPRTLDEKIKFLVNEAIDMADKSYNLKLNFTPESIQKVEEVILNNLHEEYVKRKDETGIQGLAMCYGAYIGECIRRSEPNAKWELSHPVMGENTFPIHWGGGESFPMQWCYKRILNGPEENVWAKYLVLKQERDNVLKK